MHDWVQCTYSASLCVRASDVTLTVVLWKMTASSVGRVKAPSISWLFFINLIISVSASMQLWGLKQSISVQLTEAASPQQHGHSHWEHNDWLLITACTLHKYSVGFSRPKKFTVESVFNPASEAIFSIGVLLSELPGGGGWIESRGLLLLYPQ